MSFLLDRFLPIAAFSLFLAAMMTRSSPLFIVALCGIVFAVTRRVLMLSRNNEHKKIPLVVGISILIIMTFAPLFW
ncbi:hypothetical protein JCM19037_4492 [Geomicrobium sp. JCM 19037]|uniref:hypothetical protein n=1 Tax=Geomicrobium sp. JCM 19037 TaxID=1460634 RepID=UPI00045F1A39|nr:hypothetical protein [Geomicrobium sp. JCM 19037]GAK05952.1 hypothetical protein JCM19037_4492 [Geomicrobium sp. JCM 19037]